MLNKCNKYCNTFINANETAYQNIVTIPSPNNFKIENFFHMPLV